MKKKIFVLAALVAMIALVYSCQKIASGIQSNLVPKLPEHPYNYTGFKIPESFSPENDGLKSNNEPQRRGGGYGEIFVEHQKPANPLAKPVLDISMAGDQKATLGRVLFYDKNLSMTGTVACGSCHKQSMGFSDNVAFSNGFKQLQTLRNSMPIANVLFRFNNQGLFWDMREADATKMVLMPVENHIE